MFKDEAKVASRVSGVKCGVVCLVKLLFESNESWRNSELKDWQQLGLR